MATLRDLLSLPPKEAARALVAKAFRPGFDANLLELIPPKGLSTDKVFKFTIRQKVGLVKHGILKGEHPFSIERLNWSDVFEHGLILMPMDVPEKVSDAFAFLTKKVGIQFDENDYIDAPVVLSDNGTLKVLASPQSWRWYGTVEMCFLGAPELSEDEKKKTFIQVADPTVSGLGKQLKKMERNRFLGFNGRAWFEAANIAFGRPKTWVMDALHPAEFNVGGGRVIFNGQVSDAPASLNLGQRPMKIQILLNRRLCTGMRGILTLYYSRPKD